MVAQKRKRPRKYTGVNQYFHNYEHSPQGRTHCKSNGKYPYKIKHANGNHVISNPIAIGHGRGGKPQAFRFTQRVPGGYNMASGVRISRSTMPRITPKPPKLR